MLSRQYFSVGLFVTVTSHDMMSSLHTCANTNLILPSLSTSSQPLAQSISRTVFCLDPDIWHTPSNQQTNTRASIHSSWDDYHFTSLQFIISVTYSASSSKCCRTSLDSLAVDCWLLTVDCWPRVQTVSRCNTYLSSTSVTAPSNWAFLSVSMSMSKDGRKWETIYDMLHERHKLTQILYVTVYVYSAHFRRIVTKSSLVSSVATSD